MRNGVEQWRSRQLSSELRTEPVQSLSVEGQAHGDRKVVLTIARDQIGQTDVAEQHGAGAADDAVASHGDDGNAHPEGFEAGCRSAEGEWIERDIDGAEGGHMSHLVDIAVVKVDAVERQPVLGQASGQRPAGPGIGGARMELQPKPGAGYPLEDASP
jgi:hypothetical protein